MKASHSLIVWWLQAFPGKRIREFLFLFGHIHPQLLWPKNLFLRLLPFFGVAMISLLLFLFLKWVSLSTWLSLQGVLCLFHSILWGFCLFRLLVSFHCVYSVYFIFFSVYSICISSFSVCFILFCVYSMCLSCFLSIQFVFWVVFCLFHLVFCLFNVSLVYLSIMVCVSISSL